MKTLVMIVYAVILGIVGMIMKDETLKIMSHIWIVGSMIISHIDQKGE